MLTLNYSSNGNHIDCSHINPFSNKLVKEPYSEVTVLKTHIGSNQWEPKRLIQTVCRNLNIDGLRKVGVHSAK